MKVGLSGYQWVVLEGINKPPQFLIEKYGGVLGQLIYNRKELFGENFSEEYIIPNLNSLPKANLFTHLEEIAFKLSESIRKKKRIVIYGDYDADGVTSTSVLVNFFKSINAPCRYYIPSRFDEGYGLNKNAIKSISEYGDVLIVVDSGTNAFEELLLANQLGLEVYVLDHHEPSEEWEEVNSPYLIKDVNILNPKLFNGINPLFRHLASVGITFYFIGVLKRILGADVRLKDLLDIVALGTVADAVPMSFINRALVKAGIEEINKKRRIGIRELIKNARISEEITTTGIGFYLAPRINAPGRLSDAKIAVELLTTNDNIKAQMLALEIENINKERKRITDEVTSQAEGRLLNYTYENVIVVDEENWHSGVIGIVAGRLAQKYKLPSAVLVRENGKAIGSVRSVPKVNIYKALSMCSDLLERFGGHSSAAGFTICSDKIDEFKERLNKAVKEVAKEKPWMVREIDMEIPFSYWNDQKINEIHILEPFGEKNPSPKFLATNLRLEYFGIPNRFTVRLILKDKQGKTFTGIWQKNSKEIKELSFGKLLDVVYTPKKTQKDGESIEFSIEDICIHNPQTKVYC